MHSLLLNPQDGEDNNILQWVEGKNSLRTPEGLARSGNWEAVVGHAEDQIDLWKTEKVDILRIQKSVHDVLQYRTSGPDASRMEVLCWWGLGESTFDTLPSLTSNTNCLLTESMPVPRWVIAHPKESENHATKNATALLDPWKS